MYFYLSLLLYFSTINGFIINKINYISLSNNIYHNKDTKFLFYKNDKLFLNNIKKKNIFYSNYNNFLNTKNTYFINITELSNNKVLYNKKIPIILRNTIKKFSLKDSELKHSRIAILAIIGRISAESIHPIIANKLYSDNLLVNNELVPSILNGGLNKIHPIFYMFAFMYIFLIEFNNLIELLDINNIKKINNNSSFDPLDLYNSKCDIDKKFIKYNEINIGRFAMVFTIFFSYYEYVTQRNVINPELLAMYPWVVLVIIISLYT